MSFKVGIVGSRIYTNEIKIKDLIYKLYQKYQNDLVIVSGGQEKGADGFAKKYALHFGVTYIEFPPSHYSWNEYCIRPEFEYNTAYFVSNYIKRDKQIAEYSDIIYAFIPENHLSKGTEHIIKFAEKLSKKVIRTS